MKKSLVWLYPHLQHMDGGTKFLLEVTKRLTKDYTVTVVTNSGGKDVLRSFKTAGITVHTHASLSADNNVYWLFLPLFLIRDFLVMKPSMKDADIRIATQYPSNVLLFLYYLMYNKMYYLYCYEPFPYLHTRSFLRNHSSFKKLATQLFGFLYRWTDILAVKNAKTVFTLNEITDQQIVRVYKRDALITSMGVDTGHFRHTVSHEIIKKYAGKLLITHATDYSEFKRTDLAIRAVSQVVKHYPTVLLLITSTNPHSTEKKKYLALVRTLHLAKNVQFLDFVPYKNLPLYYSLSLCYLSTSTDSRLGTTSSNLPVKEALACETPVIRANITTEDVTDGKSGFLVNPEDIDAVASKIIFFVKNQKKAREMGKSGRKTIIAKYSWNKVAETIKRHVR